MRISQKLILAFTGIVLLMGVVGYISITTIRKALEKSIGEQSIALAGNMADKIDASIQKRIEQLQTYSKEIAKETLFVNSNEIFDEMNDVQEYISRKDTEWTGAPKEQITPFMQGLINNKLSEKIKNEIELKEFYEHKYGYPIFSEVFITNKYGANVAQSQKTSDYYQADERWWQKAKDEGLYVSDIEYDESSGVYSVSIGIRIDDGEGKFLGAVKAVLNTAETIEIVKKIQDSSKYKTLSIELLTAQGEIVYKTGEYEWLKRLSEEERALYKAASGRFVLTEHGEEEEMVAYVHSKGYKDFAGLGGLVIVEYETQEIFAPVVRLRNHILVILLAVTIFSILVGLVISGSISKRLESLNNFAIEIGKGNLDASIVINSKDEIGDLAKSFNTMASNLKEITASRESLDQEVVMRQRSEEQLKQTQIRLEKQVYDLTCTRKSLLNITEDYKLENAERKQAEQEIQKSRVILQQIINSMPFGVMIIGKNKIIKQANAAAVRLSGYDEDELIGHLCHKTLCPAQEDCCPVLDQKQSVDHSERKLVTKDGKQIPIIKSVIPLTLGDEEVLLEAFVDITERKQAEESMKNLNNELGQTVHTLEAVNSELKDFVFIASHDLREPLRKIASFGSLLKDSLSGKLEADDLENFEFMIDGADRMTKMIEGLLFYSRLNNDSESFNAIDLNEIIEQLKQLELNLSLEENNTILEVSENMPKVLGDEIQIKQMLHNLIFNGIKYRAESVQPRITITAEQIDDKVKVEISDNGIGIEEKYYNEVFKMFRRLNSRQQYEGTGIGLAVCKKIIEKHNGQIGVESVPGKGSTFWFTLSLAEDVVPSEKMATLV